jgi:hypothetical protein
MAPCSHPCVSKSPIPADPSPFTQRSQSRRCGHPEAGSSSVQPERCLAGDSDGHRWFRIGETCRARSRRTDRSDSPKTQGHARLRPPQHPAMQRRFPLQRVLGEQLRATETTGCCCARASPVGITRHQRGSAARASRRAEARKGCRSLMFPLSSGRARVDPLASNTGGGGLVGAVVYPIGFVAAIEAGPSRKARSGGVVDGWRRWLDPPPATSRRDRPP